MAVHGSVVSANNTGSSDKRWQKTSFSQSSPITVLGPAGFRDFVSDAARATAWAKRHPAELGGDPQRLFVAGHSAGAQIAALLGTDARNLSAEGLKLNEIAGVIGLSGPYDFNITGKYVKIFGPPSRCRDAQAINFFDGDEPLFLHDPW